VLQLIMVIFRPPGIINSINVTIATIRVNRFTLKIYTTHLLVSLLLQTQTVDKLLHICFVKANVILIIL
jgi:hypothetical protein